MEQGNGHVAAIDCPYDASDRMTDALRTIKSPQRLFPIDVREAALMLTADAPDPITTIREHTIGAIQGILYKNPEKNRWAIFYHVNQTYTNRINFTLAHELGHYVLHRHAEAAMGMACQARDIGQPNQRDRIEYEANAFAANLLMPGSDFCNEVDSYPFSFDLMDHCMDRYDVSLMAAVWRWVMYAMRYPALLISSEDGFIQWAKSNKEARQLGYTFAPQQTIVPVPETAMAAQLTFSHEARNGIHHPAGVWFRDAPVCEYSLYSKAYAKTLTVLIVGEAGMASNPL